MDPAKMTDDELKDATAELMGWHLTSRALGGMWWADAKGALQCVQKFWSPTTRPEHSATLMRHLCESGRFSRIECVWDSTTRRKPCWYAALYAIEDRGRPIAVSSTPAEADPNGCRCLCDAAVQAHAAMEGK